MRRMPSAIRSTPCPASLPGWAVVPVPDRAFLSHFMSGLDALSWRQECPEIFYPASLLPGLREIGTWPLQTWGGVYPRTGWTQAAGAQSHNRHQSPNALVILSRDGTAACLYPDCWFVRIWSEGWPPGPLVEKDRSTGTWQMLVPNREQLQRVWYQRPREPHRLGWHRVDSAGGLCLEPLAPVQVLPPPRPVVPVRHRLVLLSAMKPKMRFIFTDPFSAWLLTSLLCGAVPAQLPRRRPKTASGIT